MTTTASTAHQARGRRVARWLRPPRPRSMVFHGLSPTCTCAAAYRLAAGRGGGQALAGLAIAHHDHLPGRSGRSARDRGCGRGSPRRAAARRCSHGPRTWWSSRRRAPLVCLPGGEYTPPTAVYTCHDHNLPALARRCPRHRPLPCPGRPFCGMLLADLGADVIKVEDTGRGRRVAHLAAPQGRRVGGLSGHQPQQAGYDARPQGPEGVEILKR